MSRIENIWVAAFVAMTVAGPSSVWGQTTFSEIAAVSGIDDGDRCSWAMSWADYDNDGDLDVYATSHLQDTVLNIHGLSMPSHLYENQGDSTFIDVTQSAGILGANDDPHGSAWADYDNDGDLDLFVNHGDTKDEPDEDNNFNELYENQGDGTFLNVAAGDVLGVGFRGRGVASADYDLDGDVDIFAAGYVNEPKGGEGSLLLRNDGGGTFVDVSLSANLRRAGRRSSAAAWLDLDGNRFPDLIHVDPDDVPSVSVYVNQGDGTFSDESLSRGTDVATRVKAVAIGDYDNDGDADLYFVKSRRNAVGGLFQNDGSGHFADVTTMSGTGYGGGGRGAAWGDYDNDGDLDLYVGPYRPEIVPIAFFENQGDGTFVDVAAAVGLTALLEPTGGDATMIDFDNDGALDIFQSHGISPCPDRAGPFELFRNSASSGNNWLKISLLGTTSNADGFGARVVLRTPNGNDQFREHFGDAHFLSHNAGPLHFGLGTANRARTIRVTWPSGQITTLRQITSNQTIEIIEGQ